MSTIYVNQQVDFITVHRKKSSDRCSCLSWRRAAAVISDSSPTIWTTMALLLGQMAGLWGTWVAGSLGSLLIVGLLTKRYSRRLAVVTAIGMLQGILVLTSTAPKLQSSINQITGAVTSEPRYPKGELTTFNVSVRTPPELKGHLLECKAPILPWLESRRIQLNSEVAIRGVVELYENSSSRYSWSRRVAGLSGECKAKQVAESSSATGLLAEWRQAIKRSIREAIGDNERAGLVLSTSFGFRDQISLGTEDIFKHAGISHVLVASGYQVGMIFLVAFSMLRWISVRHQILAHSQSIIHLKWLFPGAAAVLYTLLIGAESSAVRAGIAVVLQILALASSSKLSQLGGISASLLVLSLLAPGTVLTPGTQLTYGALIGIALGSSLSGSRFLSTVLISFIASSITGAISLLWFSEISLISPITNLILAPFISVVAVNGTILALGIKAVLPLAGDFLLVQIADCLTGLVEITEYIIPYWSFVKFETKNRGAVYFAAAVALTPALLGLVAWVRYHRALFSGVVDRGR